MYLERKQDLALYYFIKDLFSDTPFVTVTDGYPEEDLTLPTISVDADTIDTTELEIGNRERFQFRVWYIEVFAMNKSQRDEFSYRLLHALEECLPVYDYDLGNPPDILPKLGCLQPEELRMRIIKIMPELVSTLYYRATISFTATYTQF